MVKRSNRREVDDRLTRIRRKLDETNYGGSGHNFWKPKVGKNTIRIVDAVGEMDLFWQEVGKHWYDTGDGKRTFVYCLDFTTDGELECPICELVDQLYRAGDKHSKKEADDLRADKKWAMNVIVRGQENKGPQILEAGPMIFKQISAKVRDPDYGADVFDPEDGVDLVITRTGTGRTDTSYDVSPKRKNSAMSARVDTIDEWFEKATDLSPWYLTDDPEEDDECPNDRLIRLMPYERLLDFFEGLDVEEEEPDEPFPEDEEEEGDLRSSVRRMKSTGRRRSRRR